METGYEGVDPIGALTPSSESAQFAPSLGLPGAPADGGVQRSAHVACGNASMDIIGI